VLTAGDRYGARDLGAGRVIAVDFSSPNIAKLFHVGHLRGTLLGAALIRVFQYLGYRTTGINHIGDWGTQFGKLLVAYRKWGDQGELEKHAVSHLQELYVRFHQESDAGLEDEARSAFRALEAGDAEARRLWEQFRAA